MFRSEVVVRRVRLTTGITDLVKKICAWGLAHARFTLLGQLEVQFSQKLFLTEFFFAVRAFLLPAHAQEVILRFRVARRHLRTGELARVPRNKEKSY